MDRIFRGVHLMNVFGNGLALVQVIDALASPGDVAQVAAGSSQVLAPLFASVVSLLVALLGWRLIRRHRSSDHARSGLVAVEEILGKVHVEVLRLTALERAAMGADFAALRELLPRVQHVAGQHESALHDELSGVVLAMSAYIGSAVISADEVGAAYLASTSTAEVPPGLALDRLISQVQKQGREATHLIDLITSAEKLVRELRKP
ncbi:hypothetical protein [Streptomyces sp. NBC_00887]|uniref:hypothetical protein n=1 Tax=Streptomyces sp. NBC_00887 TaxID=2975859 RepID=UPI00386D0B7A|nr:hypothetical protein OG844_01330 [Streptomyces sp. NBC_00887]WSY36195.1 hypothetical protein OG844_44265 [Streptomyces sp. NBC_00887]